MTYLQKNDAKRKPRYADQAVPSLSPRFPAATSQLCATVTSGTAVQGATVSFSVAPTGTGASSVNPASSITGSNGLACTTFTAGTKSQVNTVTASVTVSGGSAITTTFSVTSNPGPATSLTIISGNSQSS